LREGGVPLISLQPGNQAKQVESISLGKALNGCASPNEAFYRDLIANNLDAFFPGRGFKLLATEFGAWQDSKRRIDILACDADGCLVLFEVKREQRDAYAELQALRYAALLSVLPSQIIEEESFAFQKKNGRPAEWGSDDWRQELADHLNLDDPGAPIDFNTSRMTIVLVADDLGSELLTTVDWLSQYLRPTSREGDGVEIEYHQLSRFVVGGQEVLQLDKVYPLPLPEDFLIRARQKQEEQRIAKGRRKKTEQLLLEEGILNPGDRLVLDPVAKASELDASGRAIVFEGARQYRWLATGQLYASLNALYREVTGLQKPVQATAFVRFEGQPDKSLADLADEVWASKNTPA
jgi:hypothetical protein